MLAVESVNNADSVGTRLRGNEFAELLEGLALLDNAVVDMGASNAEDFLGQMRNYAGSHEDFDYFVVPTVPNAKQQADTIGTVEYLADATDYKALARSAPSPEEKVAFTRQLGIRRLAESVSNELDAVYLALFK